MRRLSLAILLSLLFVVLSGCQKQQSSTTTNNTESANPAQASHSIAMAIGLTTAPNPPVSGQDVTFTATVSDRAGKAVSGAEVKAGLKMATMDMGKNEVSLTPQGEGIYVGKGKFGMAGPWNVVVTVSKSGESADQTFPVVVHRP